jgi:outer membrane lipopolysaccharide assembly protein LptE/RlpB
MRILALGHGFPVLLRAIILFTSCVGCGYHFRGTGEPLGIQYEGLAIPMMTSTSSNIGFEADFTRIIRQEFISNSKISFVPQEKAQAVLIGRIFDIKTEPLSYHTKNGIQVTRSRQLKVKLDVSLTDRVTGKVIWHEREMADQASFIVGADPLENRYNQQQALESIARSMAKRIYLKTMERF